MMQGVQYGPYPERKDVTEQIERWKKEDAEKDRLLRLKREQERESKQSEAAAATP